LEYISNDEEDCGEEGYSWKKRKVLEKLVDKPLS
jgi:hypothetical protein